MDEVKRIREMTDGFAGMGHTGTADCLRGIADALDGIAAHIGEEIDHMRDLSGYESDVMAWVEKNGGLDAVREQRRESIPRAAYERKKAGWLDHIEECEEALARRNGRIAELRRERDKLRDEAAWAESLSEILDEWADLLGFPEQKGDPGKITARVGAVLDGTWRRLMPEGMEWLRYDTGEPVPLGSEVTVSVHDEDGDFDRTLAIRSIKYKENGVLLEGTKNEMVILSHGERVRRPAPKVLDADGVEVEVGDDLYSVEGGLKFHVSHVDRANGKIATDAMFAIDKWADPSLLTHRAPVLAADGKPLREGETVWDKGTGDEYRMQRVHKPTDGWMTDGRVLVMKKGSPFDEWVDPDKLTHEAPDSWGSVWMDVSSGCETPLGMKRRCKALAERGA